MPAGVLSSGHNARDPFELSRLAEELAAREESRLPERQSTSIDLPDFQPLSHDNEYLTAPSFNVEDFLLSRSNTSLPDLRTELREYLATLKEELVRLINDDYEAFISLSTDLQGEGERLERIKWPLDELDVQIQESEKDLEEVQDSVKSKLERRANLREEKAVLQLLLKISDSINRLETLLLISSPQEDHSTSQNGYIVNSLSPNGIGGEESSKGNRAKHLLRIATEYSQLLYHANKASSHNCAFVAETQWRIERIKSTLSSDLEQSFAITLLSLTSSNRADSGKDRPPENEHAKLMSDFVDCLRAYDLLGLWRDAEDVIRREVVRGFVKKTIYPGSLSGSLLSPVVPHTPFAHQSSGASLFTRPPPTPYTPYTAFTSKQNPFFANTTDSDFGVCTLDDNDNPLAALYNQVLRFILRDMKSLMDAAERVGVFRHAMNGSLLSMRADDNVVNSTDCGFDILSNVIWDELSRAIMDDLGSLVFAAGRPDEFRKNYETTQAFIRSFEYLAPSIQAVKKFRQHPSLEAFEKRWQLPVYFQLRWKDIVGRVEEVLEPKGFTSNFSNTKSGNEPAFSMTQSLAVWNALRQCWSAEIYLPDLGPRFWRLTLQLLKRYRTWIETNLPPLDASIKRTAFFDKASGPGQSNSRAATPALSQEISSPDAAADDDKNLQQYAVLMQDLKEMERSVLRLWKEQIGPMLPDKLVDEEHDTHPENALKLALSSVTDILPLLLSQVEVILTRRCCDALTPVKSIPGQFRATSQKHMPTKPSAFVPLILRPVRLFFGVDTGEGEARTLRTDFCVPISTKVVEAVSARYISHLAGMRKTEESLRRLRVGKKSGFSLFGGTSSANDDDNRDEERVRTQMILDVRAFGKDAEALGVDLVSCLSFQALDRSVRHNTEDQEASL